MESEKNKFSVGDLVHNGRFYDALNSFTYDIPFYIRWGQAAHGPLLEL